MTAIFIATKDNISIYIHWPFCKAKCPYCDFNSHVSEKINHEIWRESYIKAISYYTDVLASRKVQSIYFGGGTPSLMRPSTIKSILETLNSISTFSTNIEITMEANPTSIEIDKLKHFKDAGVNRISIGIQSLQDHHLQFLGREHSTCDAINALEAAQKIFSRHTFDLIYALPNQSMKEWEADLRTAMELAGGHISLYQLTIEKGTPFFMRHKRGEFELPSQDDAASMYELTSRVVGEYGYNAYEVSNYAKAGEESRHNLAYWRYQDYLGIGPGAHGRLTKDGIKHATQDYYNPDLWLEHVANHGHGCQVLDPLDEDSISKERLIMGLRLEEGVDLLWVNPEKAKVLYENGLAVNSGGRFILTKSGMLVLN
ncbi:MAG: radical SAM family heme chaperone HemW, partial [Alphaproteobacteria bacterium]